MARVTIILEKFSLEKDPPFHNCDSFYTRGEFQMAVICLLFFQSQNHVRWNYFTGSPFFNMSAMCCHCTRSTPKTWFSLVSSPEMAKNSDSFGLNMDECTSQVTSPGVMCVLQCTPPPHQTTYQISIMFTMHN